MPLHRRLPKRGFTPPGATYPTIEVNLGPRSEARSTPASSAPAEPITVESLMKAGVADAIRRDGVKILGARVSWTTKAAFRGCNGRVKERCGGNREGRR